MSPIVSIDPAASQPVTHGQNNGEPQDSTDQSIRTGCLSILKNSLFGRRHSLRWRQFWLCFHPELWSEGHVVGNGKLECGKQVRVRRDIWIAGIRLGFTKTALSFGAAPG